MRIAETASLIGRHEITDRFRNRSTPRKVIHDEGDIQGRSDPVTRQLGYAIVHVARVPTYKHAKLDAWVQLKFARILDVAPFAEVEMVVDSATPYLGAIVLSG
jgi:hypothetical protein